MGAPRRVQGPAPETVWQSLKTNVAEVGLLLFSDDREVSWNKPEAGVGQAGESLSLMRDLSSWMSVSWRLNRCLSASASERRLL